MAWLKKTDDTIMQSLDDEMVILNISTEQYFALNATAKRFLEVSLASETPQDAVARLLQEFPVSADVISRDLDALLEGLQSRQLFSRS
jgi:hypothetical protein